MKVALLQYAPKWEQIDENIEYLDQLLVKLEACDLLVLPEMFTTGFTMNPQAVAEPHKGRSFLWMQNLAMKKNIAVTGSVVIRVEEHYYNRLYFILPDGSSSYYDKKHLFSLAGEEKKYQPGSGKIIIEYKGWKIAPLICYDLRFPVYSRIVNQNYDLLIYVASWPGKRIYAWDHLLKARAIENMAYVVGVNRTGIDKDNLVYPGHSQTYDYKGMPMHELMIDEKIQIVELDKDQLYKVRKKMGFLEDGDIFSLLS